VLLLFVDDATSTRPPGVTGVCIGFILGFRNKPKLVVAMFCTQQKQTKIGSCHVLRDLLRAHIGQGTHTSRRPDVSDAGSVLAGPVLSYPGPDVRLMNTDDGLSRRDLKNEQQRLHTNNTLCQFDEHALL
jgi:hypothetical protein